MQPSVIPSVSDIGGLVVYLFGNPYLFISSSTAMTSGLLIGAAAISIVPRRSPLLHAVAPALFLIFAYFGAGSFVLSLEILLRFHATLPYETGVQFVSGIGHLLLAFAGMAVLLPRLGGHGSGAWLLANTIALAYWTFQVVVLTPPWFAFQGQRELVTATALLLLALAGAVNAALWVREGRA